MSSSRAAEARLWPIHAQLHCELELSGEWVLHAYEIDDTGIETADLERVNRAKPDDSLGDDRPRNSRPTPVDDALAKILAESVDTVDDTTPRIRAASEPKVMQGPSQRRQLGFASDELGNYLYHDESIKVDADPGTPERLAKDVMSKGAKALTDLHNQPRNMRPRAKPSRGDLKEISTRPDPESRSKPKGRGKRGAAKQTHTANATAEETEARGRIRKVELDLPDPFGAEAPHSKKQKKSGNTAVKASRSQTSSAKSKGKAKIRKHGSDSEGDGEKGDGDEEAEAED